MTDRINQLLHHLDTDSVESVSHALDEAGSFTDLSLDEKTELVRAFAEVFFHAHHTKSSSMPRLAVHVEVLLASFGPDIIPVLLEEMREVDSESAVFFGKTLARFGNIGLDQCLNKVVELNEQGEDPINILQALSFFRTPEAVQSVPQILEAAKSNRHHVTAMALYCAGRLVQKLKAQFFPTEIRKKLFDSSFAFLASSHGLVRKNAARTLGKMLRRGILFREQEDKLHKAFLSITGRDEHHNWDRAFIVRREAESFLPFFHMQAASSSAYNQSFTIVTKRLLCANTYHYTIEAPLIARKIEAGQFIIVRPHAYSERIPLSICGWDREKGTIDIIISAVGKTTTELNAMVPGQTLQDVVGPLGERSALPREKGTCVVVGGGYGTGAVIPTARDIRNLGYKAIGIVGARGTDNLIMTDELKQVCDEVIITTNDGSVGMHGLVTDALRQVLDREKVVYVLAVGPVPMMKAISEMTRPLGITTYVSLNAIMVDGTGMCGACRVTVGGETKFACFHGPDFDGHKVDFENLMKRQKMFVQQEKMAMASLHV